MLQNTTMDSTLSHADANASTVTFEQPLNERMRTYLRLEFLYRQTLFHQTSDDCWSSRAAISSLLEILAITARGDPRADVLKELERQLSILNEFRAREGVDSDRLDEVMMQLGNHRDQLNSAGGAFMQNLRDSDFLNAIRLRSAIPGGTCEFDLRDYYHWLNQPFAIRQTAFNEWMASISALCEAVICLLWITRQNARPQKQTATAGHFQLNLDRDSHCQLLRISLPQKTTLFPEISGSHYRCSINFMEWHGVNTRSTQTTEDVVFLLTTCV